MLGTKQATARLQSDRTMIGVLFLIGAITPLILAVYAWSLINRRDEDGPDEPPPPPDPEAPQPIVPPSLRRRDRDPVAPARPRSPRPAPRRVGR